MKRVTLCGLFKRFLCLFEGLIGLYKVSIGLYAVLLSVNVSS